MALLLILFPYLFLEFFSCKSMQKYCFILFPCSIANDTFMYSFSGHFSWKVSCLKVLKHTVNHVDTNAGVKASIFQLVGKLSFFHSMSNFLRNWHGQKVPHRYFTSQVYVWLHLRFAEAFDCEIEPCCCVKCYAIAIVQFHAKSGHHFLKCSFAAFVVFATSHQGLHLQQLMDFSKKKILYTRIWTAYTRLNRSLISWMHRTNTAIHDTCSSSALGKSRSKCLLIAKWALHKAAWLWWGVAHFAKMRHAGSRYVRHEASGQL